ncbi:MAG TPA: hypothetical protein VER38_04935 [Candidatus Eisenbacteria bacterium]|nr:hypothetical protein [Candidatus Eisenbacteria bacterium]
MANRRDLGTVIAIAGFTLLTACSGLYLGFVAPRAMPHGKPIPRVPEQGPVVYRMQSIYSKPNRVRLEWREMPGAIGYRVTVLSADDESLFVSPRLPRNSWVIASKGDFHLARQTVYHWKVTVLFPERSETSDPAGFATQ